MTVYCVLQGFYADLVGVFATREAAEQFVAEQGGSDGDPFSEGYYDVRAEEVQS